MKLSSLFSVFSTISAVVSVLPEFGKLVNNTVQEVEQTFNQLPGAQKFAAAEAKVNSVITSVTDDLGIAASLLSLTTPLVNASVAMFNAAGVFKHKAASTTAASGS